MSYLNEKCPQLGLNKGNLILIECPYSDATIITISGDVSIIRTQQ